MSAEDDDDDMSDIIAIYVLRYWNGYGEGKMLN